MFDAQANLLCYLDIYWKLIFKHRQDSQNHNMSTDKQNIFVSVIGICMESDVKVQILYTCVICILNHFPLVPHICVSELGQHWLK